MINLKNINLHYPLLTPYTHSLQRAVYGAVGGMIGGKPNKNAYVEALCDITFSIPEGGRLGLLGHNGAGKTSLLRIICGVYPPTSGRIETQGRISALTDLTLGMDPHANGIKNIIFRLVFMGYDFATAKASVDEIVAFSELGEFIHLPVNTYSSGMYLRLAFAIATHFPPDILILDEVIGAGDEGFRVKAKTRIEDLLHKSRIVVLSSHDLEALKRYCDRGILLDHGKLVAEGDISSVVNEYISRI